MTFIWYHEIIQQQNCILNTKQLQQRNYTWTNYNKGIAIDMLEYNHNMIWNLFDISTYGSFQIM
jgi:hypothetical protein